MAEMEWTEGEEGESTRSRTKGGRREEEENRTTRGKGIPD